MALADGQQLRSRKERVRHILLSGDNVIRHRAFELALGRNEAAPGRIPGRIGQCLPALIIRTQPDAIGMLDGPDLVTEPDVTGGLERDAAPVRQQQLAQ